MACSIRYLTRSRPARCLVQISPLFLTCTLLLLPHNSARAERLSGEGQIVVVSSKVADDYSRVKQADGKFAPEVYAMGKGGLWGGQQNDFSVDKLSFAEIAKTLSVPLTAQNYISGKDPKDTKLLIMVYWGTTAGVSDFARGGTQMAADTLGGLTGTQNPPPRIASGASTSGGLSEAQMFQVLAFNRIRDRANIENGEMLGYDEEMLRTRDYWMPPLQQRKVDIVNELEKNRYFVVLMVYDFQLMWKQKKAKLLWETRYSIDQRGNDFSLQLMDMTKQASRYFGQDSGGLQRNPLPGVRVDVGTPTLIRYEDKKE